MDKLMKKHWIWISYVVYAPLKKQKKIVEKLLHKIRCFDHYNFNFYDDHVSIRLCGAAENKGIIEELNKLGCHWKGQLYDYEGRRSYELGTRAAFVYMMDKKYYDRDHNGKGIDFVEVIHGFLDDMGVSEKREARLHRKMWWHFAVRKPYYRIKKRLKSFFHKKKSKGYDHHLTPYTI